MKQKKKNKQTAKQNNPNTNAPVTDPLGTMKNKLNNPQSTTQNEIENLVQNWDGTGRFATSVLIEGLRKAGDDNPALIPALLDGLGKIDRPKNHQHPDTERANSLFVDTVKPIIKNTRYGADIVNFAYNHQEQFNFTDVSLDWMVEPAIKTGSSDIMDVVMSHEPEKNKKWITYGVVGNNVDGIRRLVQKHAVRAANYPVKEHSFDFMIAHPIAHNNAAMIDCLLDAGLELSDVVQDRSYNKQKINDKTIYTGNTILVNAARIEHEGLLDTLQDAGAEFTPDVLFKIVKGTPNQEPKIDYALEFCPDDEVAAKTIAVLIGFSKRLSDGEMDPAEAVKWQEESNQDMVDAYYNIRKNIIEFGRAWDLDEYSDLLYKAVAKEGYVDQLNWAQELGINPPEQIGNELFANLTNRLVNNGEDEARSLTTLFDDPVQYHGVSDVKMNNIKELANRFIGQGYGIDDAKDIKTILSLSDDSGIISRILPILEKAVSGPKKAAIQV